MKIQYDFFCFERLGRMYENKTFFFTKTRYFNTGFVSLQYKNTNQYRSKCSKKHTRKSQIF